MPSPSPSPSTVLNSQPSRPEDRAALGLPPMSYVEAVQSPKHEDTESSAFHREGFELNKDTIQALEPTSPNARGVSQRNGLTSAPLPRGALKNRGSHGPNNVNGPHRNGRPDTMLRSRGGSQHASIRWAPLNITLERRLQTLVVLFHTITVPIFLTAFFLACAIPLFWPLLLPYLVYISLFSNTATSGTLVRRSQFLRSLRIWNYFASYFPARLHRSVPLPATRKYIFGYHPHGIISHGAFAAFATEALGFSTLFPGITNTLLTLDSNFRLPFYRDYALAMGLASVSRESCENLLSKGGLDNAGMGRGITIVVGGASESLDAQPNSIRLVLKRRKGFVKLAIRTGADLVPVLAFGENELYEQLSSDQHPLIRKFQLLVKRTLGFTVPLFHARGVFNYDIGLMPYRRPLNIVIGRPIQVVQQRDRAKIDDVYVDELHSKYVRELQRLWKDYRGVFATERTSELEIVA
ncbi:diacylglycerol O-acyltransferase 2A [Paracoccidioides lutzii Pb01]|uniref:Diacylglycerol O-acyltransferase n=1 Tax=Paracoccidioides lutzii (strain ATCC MYA-826 / Pb01) TaxID=502779 RepID=C1GQN9_PARBA|nr:diacylglycerol O-acyltransferase 2A [Paracoccidioides lutzii Pb01]EEH37913.1 diacylglycerol O-acyltransferase 2A [Paracoccidioides lutzii Pb01]